MHGPAFTVSIHPPDSGALHVAVDLARPGDVVVIECTGARGIDSDRSPVGGIIGTLLRDRGVAGIVVDGPVADVAELRALGIPTFSRGLSPLTTFSARRGTVGKSVRISRQLIRPGAFLLGDDDGVIVLRRRDAVTHAVSLRRREENDASFVERVRAGAELSVLTGAAAHITRRGRPRRLDSRQEQSDAG